SSSKASYRKIVAANVRMPRLCNKPLDYTEKTSRPQAETGALGGRCKVPDLTAQNPESLMTLLTVCPRAVASVRPSGDNATDSILSLKSVTGVCCLVRRS